MPGSFFPWEFLLNDVGEGTPSSIGPFEERIERSDQTCRMGSFLGDIFFMQFRWTILFWSPEQKLRVDIFPPFLAVCSAPGMEFKMNSKYQKSPNTKKKAELLNPRSSHVVLSDRVLIDLKIHSRIDTHIASFCLGKTSIT